MTCQPVVLDAGIEYVNLRIERTFVMVALRMCIIFLNNEVVIPSFYDETHHHDSQHRNEFEAIDLLADSFGAAGRLIGLRFGVVASIWIARKGQAST